MSMNEANALIDAIAAKDRVSWEQARWISYIQAITQGATLKTPTDLIKFSWEEPETNTPGSRDTRTKEEIRNNLIEIANSLL